ncbi:helix-turn-helix domain-containing protein [Cryptosporangium sp. NPDC051539]|uniref:helix-turn-helix domain-containing protein n=1 Tax=Cryptosporangium sp. NPDC051539 TaxID=3363962 RepID=UPI0037A92FE9
MDEADPTVLKRILLAELHELRLGSLRTQRQVAAAMEWSVSKVLRVESGAVRITTHDLRGLLRLYGVTEEEQERYIDMNRNAMKREGWSAYGSVFDTYFVSYLGLEGVASIARYWETTVFPGLLQTGDYARAVVNPDESLDRRELRTQARLDRQEILHEAEKKFFFLVDESVFYRTVGSPGVMITQLEYIRKVCAENPNVDFRVVLFNTGLHPGTEGPCTVLEFTDPRLGMVAYLENSRRDSASSLRDDPQEASKYLDRFFKLEDIACSQKFTLELVERRIAELESEENAKRSA